MEGKEEIDKSLVKESTSRLFFVCLFFGFFFVVLFRLDESRHNISLSVKINLL